jgi:hypothetical protein
MIIQVDWYREGGKWYSGGEVTIPDDVPSFDAKKVLRAIIEEQKVMDPNWHLNCSYFVVVADLPESLADRNYSNYFGRHWKPEQIKAVGRGE